MLETDKRRELHDKIKAAVSGIVSGDQIYYQPPEGFRLDYPCIVYEMTGVWDRFGSGKRFAGKRKYQMMLITRDPDCPAVEKLLGLTYTALDRTFTTDNLYHYTFTIYY